MAPGPPGDGAAGPQSGPEAADDADAALVAAIARGDQAGTRAFVARHLPRMHALAYRLLGNAADAEDVVQDLFVKVWKQAPDWRPGRARFSTWMHRVAVNLCYDRLRRRRELTMAVPPERADPAPDPAQALHLAESSARVRRALDGLPERQRIAIVLCHYQGLGNAEAAEILQVSVEAVESLLSRGRKRLRGLLLDEAQDLMDKL